VIRRAPSASCFGSCALNFPYYQLPGSRLRTWSSCTTMSVKHAGAVPESAAAIDGSNRERRPPGGWPTSSVRPPRVRDVSTSMPTRGSPGGLVTVSERAGAGRVAELAGRHLKGCALELGWLRSIHRAWATMEPRSGGRRRHLRPHRQQPGQSCKRASKRIHRRVLVVTTSSLPNF